MLAVLRSPVIALVLALLLTVSLPPSGAQIVFSFGSEDQGFGWTFPEGEFPGSMKEDPAGDVEIVVGPQSVPGGAVPLHAAGDIQAVHLDEVDGELLRLRIVVADIDPQTMQLENGFGLTTVRYDVRFNVSGVPYLIGAYFVPTCSPNAVGVCEPATQPGVALVAGLRAVTAQGSEAVGDLPTRVLPDADQVEILLPRWALDRPGPGRHPLAGDAVTGLGVEARAGFCLLGGGVLPQASSCLRRLDRAPDTPDPGTVYVLTVDSHGSRIGLDAPRPQEPPRDEDLPQPTSDNGPLRPRVLTIDVDAGDTVRVPLVLTNDMDRKALIQPRVSVMSSHDASPTVPATVSVPSGESRVFTVDLRMGAAGAAEPVVLAVDVRALGTVGETGDRMTLHVRPVPALSADNPRLYLHTVGEDFTGLAEHSTILTYSEGMLSTLAQDPLDNGYGSTLSWSCLCSDSVREWPAAGALARDVHLDPQVPAVLHIEADVPLPGTLVVETAVAYGEDTVAVGGGEYALQQGVATIDVPLAVAEEAASLRAGGSFFLAIEAFFRPVAPVPLGELAGLVQPIDPRLKTEGASWLELPIVAAADRYGGAAHLVVDLARGHDAVRYTNPGKTVLWNVTVLNQGDVEDVVAVTATTDAAWKLRLEPGQRYAIGAGESVTLGVLATAPADANEGAVAKVNVTVASDLAEGAVSGLGVTAVVTAGIDIDEPSFKADNDTAAAVQVERKEKGSPAPSLALVALGAFLFVARASRSRAGRTR